MCFKDIVITPTNYIEKIFWSKYNHSAMKRAYEIHVGLCWGERGNSEQSLTVHFDNQAKFVQIRLFPENQNTQLWGKSNIPDLDVQWKCFWLGLNPSPTTYWWPQVGHSTSRCLSSLTCEIRIIRALPPAEVSLLSSPYPASSLSPVRLTSTYNRALISTSFLALWLLDRLDNWEAPGEIREGEKRAVGDSLTCMPLCQATVWQKLRSSTKQPFQKLLFHLTLWGLV